MWITVNCWQYCSLNEERWTFTALGLVRSFAEWDNYGDGQLRAGVNTCLRMRGVGFLWRRWFGSYFIRSVSVECDVAAMQISPCFDTIWYDIFVNCNWVASRWQQYSTHLHTNSTQNDTKQTIHETIPKFLEECGPCPVYASFTLAFALQLRKKHGKTSVRVAEEWVPAGTMKIHKHTITT